MMSEASGSLPPKEDREHQSLFVLNNLSLVTGILVLVVDDNEDSLLLTSFILESYGIRVMKATSASEALTKFLHTKPDLVIFDIAMPYEDGYSLIRKIRKLKPEQGAQILAISMTALPSNEYDTLSIEAGFQAHLVKPIEPDVLIKVVAELIKTSGVVEHNVIYKISDRSFRSECAS